MGQKLDGWGLCPFFWGGARSPTNTKSPGWKICRWPDALPEADQGNLQCMSQKYICSYWGSAHATRNRLLLHKRHASQFNVDEKLRFKMNTTKAKAQIVLPLRRTDTFWCCTDYDDLHRDWSYDTARLNAEIARHCSHVLLSCTRDTVRSSSVWQCNWHFVQSYRLLYYWNPQFFSQSCWLTSYLTAPRHYH